MLEPPYLIFLVAIILIALLAVLLTRTKQGKKTKPDYFLWFVIGITWTAIGIPLKIYPFFLVGIIFLVVSLIHKKEWKQNHKSWKNLDDKTKKIKLLLIILVFGLAALIAAFLVYLKF